MKVAITGHTAGIGKELYNYFSRKNAEVIGMSRSNGYDLETSVDSIIENAKDCDIFINNAFDSFGQTLMLLDLFYKWKDTKKTIINVGSVVAEDETVLKNYEYLLEYQIQKKSLKVLHYDLLKLNYSVNLKYVYFGYVGTERILKKYPDLSPDKYITVDEAVKKILL
jgi:hypothetical protein